MGEAKRRKKLDLSYGLPSLEVGKIPSFKVHSWNQGKTAFVHKTSESEYCEYKFANLSDLSEDHPKNYTRHLVQRIYEASSGYYAYKRYLDEGVGLCVIDWEDSKLSRISFLQQRDIAEYFDADRYSGQCSLVRFSNWAVKNYQPSNEFVCFLIGLDCCDNCTEPLDLIFKLPIDG